MELIVDSTSGITYNVYLRRSLKKDKYLSYMLIYQDLGQQPLGLHNLSVISELCQLANS